METVEGLRRDLVAWRERCRDARRQKDEWERKAKRYEAALRWYASLESSDHGVSRPSKLGERARQALSQDEGETPDE